MDEYQYDRLNMFYSRGQISFAELISVIKGNISLEALEAERMFA